MVLRLLMLAVLSVLLTVPAFASPQDLSDTLVITGGPLYLGKSKPLYVQLGSDEELMGLSWSLRFATAPINGGFARMDSIVFVERMRDPQVLNLRMIFPRIDGVGDTDTLSGHFYNAGGELLAPGRGRVFALYFTGLRQGRMDIHRSQSPVADVWGVFVPRPGGDFDSKYLRFDGYSVQITTAPAEPQIAAEVQVIRSHYGSTVNFPVSFTIPSGNENGTLSYRMFKTENPSDTPLSQPSLSSGNPATFSWNPSGGDIGIWTARIIVSDEIGQKDSVDVAVQIVESAEMLVGIDAGVPISVTGFTGMTHGSFDSDYESELVVTGWGTRPENSLEIYDVNGGLQRIVGREIDSVRSAPVAAYINGDGYLDIALKQYSFAGWRANALLGGPGTSLTQATGGLSNALAFSSAIGEFTGDASVDFVSYDFNSLLLHPGSANGVFGLAQITPALSRPKSINAADFDNDGLDDVALGTVNGVEIYLRTALGQFNRVATYAQQYGSVDIEITNQGSDLNGDGIFDLCISTPSVGGLQSQMVVYYGNGDGTFVQHEIRTVYGHILGNSIGDFNGDALLDIAFINGSYRYVGIVFGDGEGNFLNELRYEIPGYDPQLIDCFDADLDGDLDIVVAARRISTENALFLLTNETNPSGLSPRKLEIFAHDNVKVAVTAQSGRMINDLCNSMPASSIHKRRLDANTALDHYVDINLIETGEYIIEVLPKKADVASTFSLECRIDGALYCFGRNVTCNTGGLRFGFFPEGGGVSPTPGGFFNRNAPTFRWAEGGSNRLQLATDPSFENLLLNTTVTGNSFTYSGDIGGAERDTVTYYWRVCPLGGKFNKVYAFNVSGTATPVADQDEVLPTEFSVAQNHPNPFNPATTISYTLAKPDAVKVEVFNTLGQTVSILVDETQTAGQHAVEWRGVDATGRAVPSGVYFYRVTAGANQAVRKMVLLK